MAAQGGRGVIISASRRTDIPALYSAWFFTRLREGFALVRNPMNPRQVSRVSLAPRDTDGFVFWSKNPAPMLPELSRHLVLPFYFQYSLNGYGREVEPGLPPLPQRIETLRRIAGEFGPERVVVRVDPVLRNARYDAGFHLAHLERLAQAAPGAFDLCVFSFMDAYVHIRKPLAALDLLPMDAEWRYGIAQGFSRIAEQYGFSLATCAEPDEYADLRIAHASCIDPLRMGRIAGYPIRARKDSGQRPACGCAVSADIGAYHNCVLGCRYCYANVGPDAVRKNHAAHNPDGPFLLGGERPDDRVSDRK